MNKWMITTAILAIGLMGGTTLPTAQAGLLPVSLLPVAQLDGNFRWTYQIVLPTDTMLKNGDFFTIYDFAGFVPNSNGQPSSNWQFSSANLGLTPPGLAPVDNTSIPNLTWQYTGVATPIGQLGLGNFWAASQYSAATTSNFTARTTKVLDGRKDSNITTTTVPVPTAIPVVPEPATLAMAGLGLPLVGMVRMIRRRHAVN